MNIFHSEQIFLCFAKGSTIPHNACCHLILSTFFKESLGLDVCRYQHQTPNLKRPRKESRHFIYTFLLTLEQVKMLNCRKIVSAFLLGAHLSSTITAPSLVRMVCIVSRNILIKLFWFFLRQGKPTKASTTKDPFCLENNVDNFSLLSKNTHHHKTSVQYLFQLHNPNFLMKAQDYDCRKKEWFNEKHFVECEQKQKINNKYDTYMRLIFQWRIPCCKRVCWDYESQDQINIWLLLDLSDFRAHLTQAWGSGGMFGRSTHTQLRAKIFRRSHTGDITFGAERDTSVGANCSAGGVVLTLYIWWWWAQHQYH